MDGQRPQQLATPPAELKHVKLHQNDANTIKLEPVEMHFFIFFRVFSASPCIQLNHHPPRDPGKQKLKMSFLSTINVIGMIKPGHVHLVPWFVKTIQNESRIPRKFSFLHGSAAIRRNSKWKEPKPSHTETHVQKTRGLLASNYIKLKPSKPMGVGNMDNFVK